MLRIYFGQLFPKRRRCEIVGTAEFEPIWWVAAIVTQRSKLPARTHRPRLAWQSLDLVSPHTHRLAASGWRRGGLLRQVSLVKTPSA